MNDRLPAEFPKALARLGNDIDLLREVAQIYLDDSPALLRDIQQACLAGDLKRVAHAAHRLKGLTANLDEESAREVIEPVIYAARAGSQRQSQKLLVAVEKQVSCLQTRVRSR